MTDDTNSCDLRVDLSRLHYRNRGCASRTGCDLRVDLSRLHLFAFDGPLPFCCDLRVDLSRLHFADHAPVNAEVVICA